MRTLAFILLPDKAVGESSAENLNIFFMENLIRCHHRFLLFPLPYLFAPQVSS
jgi:hypothetical protein